MIEPYCHLLGISALCQLLSLTRSSFYYIPPGESEENLAIMHKLDEQYFSTPILWCLTIWPLAIADLGEFTKTAASLLVMGIVGGAVLPLIFGFLVDLFKSGEVSAVSDYQSAYWIFIPACLFIFNVYPQKNQF